MMSDFKKIYDELLALDRKRERGVMSKESMSFWAVLDAHWVTVEAALAAAAYAGTDQGRPRWKHKVRGTYYTEMARGFASVADMPIVDHTAVVVYRGDDGTIWVRNAVEFDDGRFLPVPEKGSVKELAERIKARSQASSSDDVKELRRQMMHIASLADAIIKS